MAPPSASNALIFCRDLGSANGTYLRSHRLRKHESILLGHGDCLDFRHAGKIYVLQFNVFVANIDKVIGDGKNLGRLDKAFQIQRRLIGEGGQAKVHTYPFRPHHSVAGIEVSDIVGSKSRHERTSRLQSRASFSSKAKTFRLYQTGNCDPLKLRSRICHLKEIY